MNPPKKWIVGLTDYITVKAQLNHLRGGPLLYLSKAQSNKRKPLRGGSGKLDLTSSKKKLTKMQLIFTNTEIRIRFHYCMISSKWKVIKMKLIHYYFILFGRTLSPKLRFLSALAWMSWSLYLVRIDSWKGNAWCISSIFVQCLHS